MMYHIYDRNRFVAAFTVKREASVFAGFFGYDTIKRVGNGIFESFENIPCDFNEKAFNDGKIARAKCVDHVFQNGGLICEPHNDLSSDLQRE